MNIMRLLENMIYVDVNQYQSHNRHDGGRLAEHGAIVMTTATS